MVGLSMSTVRGFQFTELMVGKTYCIIPSRFWNPEDGLDSRS